MKQLLAFSSLIITLGLVVTRPRLAKSFRVTPPIAAAVGVAVLGLGRLLSPGDLLRAGQVLWRPFLTIASIMVITSVANHLGLIEKMVSAAVVRARGSSYRLFAVAFFASSLTAAALNNDAGIILLTPIIVAMVRRLYPVNPELVVPFAFAAFVSAGVAPLITSNPMNMVVADYAGIHFNDYAQRMIPITIAGWVVAFIILRWIFRKSLAGCPAPQHIENFKASLTRPQWQVLLLLVGLLAAYPIVSYYRKPIVFVALSAALVSLALLKRHSSIPAEAIFREGVSWSTLMFLSGVFLIATGLQNAGLVEILGDLYKNASHYVIGVTSALGSAAINNHPMALINMLALEVTPRSSPHEILAALIGGDLGPRLLPIGSLAGLLWLDILRKLQVEVPLGQFVVVGFLVTAPSLAISLLLLGAL